MKRIPAALTITGLVVAGLVYAWLRADGEMPWLDAASLEDRLAGRDQITVPADHLVSPNHFLCAVGSYESRLPDGYGAAELELENAGFTPVKEGWGLLLSLDKGRRLQHVTSLSVRPNAVMLDVAEPLCLPASAAHLYVRREDGSIVITLEDGRMPWKSDRQKADHHESEQVTMPTDIRGQRQTWDQGNPGRAHHSEGCLIDGQRPSAEGNSRMQGAEVRPAQPCSRHSDHRNAA